MRHFDDGDLSREERRARNDLIEVCLGIAEEYEYGDAIEEELREL